MTRRAFAALVFVSALVVPGIAAAARSIRIDNPGAECELLDWGGMTQDPYMLLNGDTDGMQDLSTFFNAGTVTTGDLVNICWSLPTAAIWSSSSPYYDPKEAGNPASKPNDNGAPTIPSLTATSGIMYEWENYSSAVNDPPAADVEVIVWSIPPSATLPTGAFELELDNWCGLSPAEAIDTSTQVGPAANSSLTWAGNVYTAKCANFGTNGTGATDLLMSPSGALLGYVDSSNTTHVTTSVPGWQAPTSVNMTAVNNVFGIGTLGTTTTGGGLDGTGSSYAGNLLGSSLTWSGATFQFSWPGPNSAASEVVIPLPAGEYSTLKLLGTAVNGSHPNHAFIVTYTDGTQSTFTQSLSNWNSPQKFPGETIAATTAYKLLVNGTEHTGAYNVYGYSFTLNSGKTPKSLTLPSDRDVIALAVDLVP